MNQAANRTTRSLRQVLEDRKVIEQKLVELSAPAAVAVAAQFAELYGLEAFQTTDVLVWLTQNSQDFNRLPYLGRSALVRAIRQNGWRKKTLRPVYGVAMHVWVRDELVGGGE